jgi:hypothetical protein
MRRAAAPPPRRSRAVTSPTMRLVQHHRRKVLAMASDFRQMGELLDARAAGAGRAIVKLNAIATLLLTAADDMEDLRVPEVIR